MRLSGEAYSKRLRSYSDDTIRLIADINNGCSKKVVYEKTDITTNSELSEEEVAEKLKALLEASRETEQ